MNFDALVGKDVVIWGAGREGRAAHAELARRGIPSVLAVTDRDTVEADVADIAIAGDPARERLAAADVVVKSPGIPRSSADFQRVSHAGPVVTSLSDLWLDANAHRAIGVTGTKGKSTTSALIHHLLSGAGVSGELVGNGGVPVTAGADRDADVAVVEISSYQAAELTVSPRVAVVTSIFPEHLPWHGGFETYVKDKLNLVAHGPDVVVIPETTGDLAGRVAESTRPSTSIVSPATVGISVTADAVVWDDFGEIRAGDFGLRGQHNLVNLALALTAVDSFLDTDPDRDGDGDGDGDGARRAMISSARSFAPLEHRLEQVPSADGRIWVDDTLATAPEAVVAALETYPADRVTLIFGGADRGLAHDVLTDYLMLRSEASVDVIAVGPAGKRLVDEGGDVSAQMRLAPNFSTALEWAREDPDRHDVVLLSPGAPSFDEFASFEQRGAAFRAAALER